MTGDLPSLYKESGLKSVVGRSPWEVLKGPTLAEAGGASTGLSPPWPDLLRLVVMLRRRRSI
jgi:hypothetical protein